MSAVRPLLGAILLATSLCFAYQEPVKPVEPPEEDESTKPREYGFNPLQAQKEMKVGEFYWKKKSWRAAATRFEEATKWDPNLADAFLRLGEAREKLNDKDGMKVAFLKYIELVPDSKLVPAIKKKLGVK